MLKQEAYIYNCVTVYRTFEISIMLNLETNTKPNYLNIFGFRKEVLKAYDDRVIGNIPYGSRIPAVFQHPKSQEYQSAYSSAISIAFQNYQRSHFDTYCYKLPIVKTCLICILVKSNKLHVCMALNGNGNRCWNSPEMPANTWFKLQIGQYHEGTKYIYKIWINDELKLSVINNQPMIFEGVNGIVGHAYPPEQNWKPAAGRYKDFHFTSPNIGKNRLASKVAKSNKKALVLS